MFRNGQFNNKQFNNKQFFRPLIPIIYDFSKLIDFRLLKSSKKTILLKGINNNKIIRDLKNTLVIKNLNGIDK